MTYVILCTGESLSHDDIEYVRDCREKDLIKGVIAVSDAAKLTPWADVMVSHDSKWWKHHWSWAKNLKMRKFSRQTFGRVELYVPKEINGCNSGLMAAMVARDVFEAEKIVFLGLDMKGTHYFGKHPEPLRNATSRRFTSHINQFEKWEGCPIINCSKDSALKCFPIMDLKIALQSE